MVAPSLEGWKRIFTADGLLFVDPRGPGVASLSIRRKRPLITSVELIDKLTRQLAGRFEGIEHGPPTRSVTMEGEYCVAVSFTARVKGQPGVLATRDTYMILGDDSYDSIDFGTTVSDEHAAMRDVVKNIAYKYSLGLGESRRRRYFFPEPPGWSAVPRPNAVMFLTPTFPKNLATITVFDARPATLTPGQVNDRRLFQDLSSDLVEAERLPRFTVFNRFGLRGHVSVVSGKVGGRRYLYHDTALVDRNWIYFLRLETTEEHLQENRKAYSDVLASVEPLPVGTTGNPATLIQWAE